MASESTTPLMAQYQAIKDNYKNEVLFFRLGDFYEMFGDDAVEVSRLLNLTLTHRASDQMCGIPYHAAKIYIARLLRLGKKIAIAEQIGDPKAKGLTERKVIEVITPGTAVETEYLDGNANNFLVSLFVEKNRTGFAWIDVTTGEFFAENWETSRMSDYFPKELGRIHPKEILLPDSLKDNRFIKDVLESNDGISVSYYPDWNFDFKLSYSRLLKQFGVQNLKAFSLDEKSAEVPPAGFLLDYLVKTASTQAPHVNEIKVFKDTDFLVIDDSSRRNLELLSNLRDGSSQFSLFECVNFTRTAMGNRLLRSWISSPLTDIKGINSRLSHVELFSKNRVLLDKVYEVLGGILDIERLASRIAMERAHPKDVVALKNSLSSFLKVRSLIENYGFSKVNPDNASMMIDLISSSILDDPCTIITDGGIIRDGWSSDLDHYRNLLANFNQYLEEYLEEERSKTGIQNLKIKYSNNAGYFIEVSRGKIDQVPSHFIIRRALVNADRYTTERLQSLEKDLTEAQSHIKELERDLFLEIRSKLNEHISYLMETAREIAYCDCISSLSVAANTHGWTKPVVDDSGDFIIKNGRHPVVELHLPKGEFVPNDTKLCTDGISFALITGPNMAGKSTYLRQNALITILAQTGSFVPADEAKIGVVDKVFCRVGASDNLARGESTFLVEMTETAHILRSATEKSLVIMDEVGRGTSTEDGLSIAWAVSEYLLSTVKSRTFFATHYHELTRLEHTALKLLCMAVSESDGNIVFLRKIKEGASENSYGLHVASLAGVPEFVINRASQILEQLQNTLGGETSAKNAVLKTSVEKDNMRGMEKKQPHYTEGGLFSDEELIINEILSVDADNLTPMNALQMIARWKSELSG